LRRFEAPLVDPLERWADDETAIADLIGKTSTAVARRHLIPANSKSRARCDGGAAR